MSSSWTDPNHPLYGLLDPPPPSGLFAPSLVAAWARVLEMSPPPVPALNNRITGLMTAPPASGLAAFATPITTPPVAPAPPPPQWLYVRQRFSALIEDIGVTQPQIDDGWTKIGNVIACLNRAYLGTSDRASNLVLAGSWHRQTRVRPSADIDLLYVLPYDTYLRYERRAGNRQSDLLQEVKAVLAATFSRTTSKADGQVVVVDFGTIKVEVVPCFQLTDGRYWTCDTHDGGRYELSDPQALADDVALADLLSNGNARHMARLAKLWQRHLGVKIKPYLLERLAVEFIRGWPNAGKDAFWYDWMVRDFFAFLVSRANGWVILPGTGRWVALGDAWLPAAKWALEQAQAACLWEQNSWDGWATESWQKIFGPRIKSVV